MTERLQMDEMEVICQDVLGYMKEYGATLKQAYEEIGVPDDMRVDIDEMQDFLYPDGLSEKS